MCKRLCLLRNRARDALDHSIMTDEEILHEFRASEALLEGHFKLSSGRHSGHYL